MATVSTKCRGVGAKRVTSHIKQRSASNLWHAVQLAEKIQLPLTHFATIHFTGCPEEEASKRFERLRNNFFSPWMRRPLRRKSLPGCAPTYVWVMENKSGIIHVHWLVHLPSGRIQGFHNKLKVWLEKVTDIPVEPGMIKVDNAKDPVSRFLYMEKGIEPFWGERLGIIYEDQGLIHGKRAGSSFNIGKTAKKRLREAGLYKKCTRHLPGRTAFSSAQA